MGGCFWSFSRFHSFYITLHGATNFSFVELTGNQFKARCCSSLLENRSRWERFERGHTPDIPLHVAAKLCCEKGACIETQWMNPCMSSSRTGLWDPFYNNSVNSIYSLYNAVRSQSCSMQDLMCLNIDHANVVARLVDFSFPLGDNLITPEMLTSSEPYSLYVSFQISLVDSDGAYVQTRLFAQTAITPVSMTRVCRELEIANELKDVVDVSMTVGMVGVEEEWGTTIKEFDHMEDNQDALVKLSVEGVSPSIMNGLVTIVVQGTPAPFDNPLASAYHLEIDDLFTMHFLHDAT